MIELGNTPPGAGAAGAEAYIRDVTEETFMADVVEASRDRPIIASFCRKGFGPCDALDEMLEKEVRTSRGALGLARIDVDRNQRLAAHLGVQTFPTVVAVFQGQQVGAISGEGFSGAQVKDLVRQLLQMAGGGGLDEALDMAEQMLDDGKAEDAAQTFGAIMAEDPENPRAIGGLARALLALGMVEEAKRTLDAAPPQIQRLAPILAARSQIELHEMASGAGEVDELRAKVAADPDDHQARFDLAVALIARRENEAAMDELLELFRRDREWNEGAAKAQLIKLFDSLGPKDPLVARGRRRLTSMIFL